MKDKPHRVYCLRHLLWNGLAIETVGILFMTKESFQSVDSITYDNEKLAMCVFGCFSCL